MRERATLESHHNRGDLEWLYFIDPTHVVRIDGEVPYLVLEVLPALPPGVLVHVHDVHFPYNVPVLPRALTKRFWKPAS